MKQKLTCVLAILLVLALTVFPVSAEGNGGSAAITPEGLALPGKTVELTISLADMPAYDDLGVEFSYDTSQLRMESGEWLSEGGLMDVDAENGLAVWTGTRVEAINGKVLTVEFLLDENVTAGTEITVSCTVTARAKGKMVASLTESTSLVVSAYILGDVNDDGAVDTDDPIYLLYYTLFGDGLYPVNQECDFNGDGAVDTDDAIYLLYFTLFGDSLYPLQ